MTTRERARQVFDIGCYVLVAAVVIQFYLAGLGIFAGASLALLAIPGPAVIYVVTRSLDQGRAAGIVSASHSRPSSK